jgi:hypothetical protein
LTCVDVRDTSSEVQLIRHHKRSRRDDATPGRHGWASCSPWSALCDGWRTTGTLDDADRARRIRDRFGEDDGRFDGGH